MKSTLVTARVVEVEGQQVSDGKERHCSFIIVVKAFSRLQYKAAWHTEMKRVQVMSLEIQLYNQGNAEDCYAVKSRTGTSSHSISVSIHPVRPSTP